MGGHTDFKIPFIGRFPSNGAVSMAMTRLILTEVRL